MKGSVIPSRPVASSTELWIALEWGWHHKDKEKEHGALETETVLQEKKIPSLHS